MDSPHRPRREGTRNPFVRSFHRRSAASVCVAYGPLQIFASLPCIYLRHTGSNCILCRIRSIQWTCRKRSIFVLRTSYVYLTDSLRYNKSTVLPCADICEWYRTWPEKQAIDTWARGKRTANRTGDLPTIPRTFITTFWDYSYVMLYVDVKLE